MKKLIFITSFFITTFLVAQQTSNILEEVVEYKKIDTISLKLHIYKSSNFDKNKSYPVIVFFHGGGWNNGKHTAFQRQSRELATKGMIAISADYRVKNIHGTTPFDAVKDAKSAIRYVRKHASQLNVNPNMIASGGGSAGGHLASVCANIEGLEDAGEDLTISSKPNALVLFNPVYDNSKNGYGYWQFKERYIEISPMHHITKGAPPTIVFFGTNDEATPVASSKEYEKRMQDVGSRIELNLYEGAEHSFFYKPEYYADVVEKMDVFLTSLGYLEK